MDLRINVGREEPGKVPAGILAVLVHLLFIGLLVFGVSWQSKPPAAVTAELWSNLPPAPAVARPAVSRPEPKEVEPTPPKEVPKPEPKPEPKPRVEPKAEPKPPVVKPDIQLKEKEQKRLKEEKEKQEEQKRKLEKEKLEKEKLQKEQQQKQQLQKAQAEQQRLQKEQAAAYQAAQAGVQSKVNDFKGRIQGKIKRFIILPPDLQGNPQAEFDVVLLPSGDVLSVKLTRTSGNAAYDSAVERAIYKAQPLPLPPDPSLFSAFRELHLKFRPQEDN